VPATVPSRLSSDLGPEIPPDLAEVVAAWSTLPYAVRAGVLAMVRATGK